MPAFIVTGPDGKKYRVNTPEGGTGEDAVAYIRRAVYEKNAQPDGGQSTVGAIGRGVVRGAGSLVSGLGDFIEEAPSYIIPGLAKASVPGGPAVSSVLDTLGVGDKITGAVKPLTDAAQRVYEPGGKFEGDKFRQMGQRITGSVLPRDTKSFFDEEGWGKLASLRDTVAESSVPTIAGILTGALTKNPEAAMAVMGLGSLPQEYSGIREQQRQTGQNDPAKAMEHALAVSFSDAALGTGGEATHLLTGRIAKGFAQDVMHGLKGWGRTALEEAVTESLQNVAEQHGAGMDPTTWDNFKQTLEAGLAGAAGAGVFGGTIAGINKVVESKAKAAVRDVEPLHQLQVEMPSGKDGATERQTIDIISRPDQTGAVIIRDQSGTPHRASLEQLQNMAVPDETGAKPDIAGVVEEAASNRDAALDQQAQNQEVATAAPALGTTPEEAAQAIAAQRFKNLGLPEDYAKEHVAKVIGGKTEATEPTAVPESEPAPQIEAAAPVAVPETVQTENTAPAPAPVAPSVTYKGTTYSLEQAVDKFVSTPESKKPKWLNEFVKANPEAVSAELARRQTEEAAQRNAELAQQYNLPTATEEEIAARDKNVSQELVAPPATEEVPTVAETARTEAEPKTQEADVLAEANTPPKPGAEAPAETAPEVPVTKVAPGVARGVKETRRGQMGTQMGRPVEGAAALTEGNREEQKLYSELDAARSRREISDQEHADVLNFLRPPADEGALRAMPGEQRQQWLTAIAAQKNVDDWQSKLRDIPKDILGKPNPVYQDAEQELGKRQQSLDAVQREIVNTARKQAEKYARDRANARIAARRAFKRGEIDRREFNIRMHELAVRSAALPMKGDEALGYTPEAARAIEAAISDHGFAGALDYASKNARTPFEKELMGRIRMAVRKLEKLGVKSDAVIVHDEMTDNTYANAMLERGHGVTMSYADGSARIYLNADNSGRPTGMTQGVLAHELLHAATAPIVALYDTYGTGDSKVEAAVKELRDILAQVKKHVDTAAANDNETELESNLKEALADENELLAWGLTSPDMQKLLSNINVTPRQTLLQKFVNALRKLIGLDPKYTTALSELTRLSNKILNASPKEVADLVHASFLNEHARPDPVLNAMAAPNVQAQQQKTNAALQKVRQSQKNSGVLDDMDKVTAEDNYTREEFTRNLLTETKTKAVDIMLGKIANMSTILDTLARMGDGVMERDGAWHRNTENLNKQVQLMHGLRSKMREAVGRMSKKLDTFVRANGQETLGTAMFMARDIAHDPRQFTSRADALANDPGLVYVRNALANMPAIPTTKRDKRLKTQAQRALRVREDNINTYWEHAWEPLGAQVGGREQASSLWDYFTDMYSISRAERVNLIKSLGLSEADENSLLEAMEARDKGEENMPTNGDFAIPSELLPNMYYPHDRYGNYALSIKGTPHTPAEFYMAETAMERDKILAREAKRRGLKRGTDEYNDTFDLYDNRVDLVSYLSKDDFYFAKMMEIIKNKDNADTLRDELMQLYFMTAPEQSLKRHMLHARLVTGYNADVGRVFRVNASKYSGSIPKAIQGPAVRQAMSQMEGLLETREGDPQRRRILQNVVNVLKQSVNEEMQPDMIPDWERNLNNATFFFVMTSAGSAVVQTLTVPTQVLGRMVTIHGPVEGLKKFGKYMASWKDLANTKMLKHVDPVTGSEYWGVPSIRNTPMIKDKPLLAKAYDALQDRAAFDVKGTTMLLQNAPTVPTGRNKGIRAWQRVVNWSGAAFGAADHIAREHSAMALFELHYEHLKDFDAAVEETMRDLDRVGGYTTWDKPGMFKGGPLRRMFGYLRMWQLNRLMLSYKLLRDMTVGSPYQTRMQAASELGMTMLTSALFAGGQGMLGYGAITLIVDLIQKAWGALNSDDRDKWKREDPLGAFNSDYRFNYEFLPRLLTSGKPGETNFALEAARRGVLSAGTGWDFSGRLSQSNLIYRPWIQSDETWQNIVNALTTNFSPHTSTAAGIARGVDDLGKGNWSRAASAFAPAAIRGLIVADRLEREGETNRKGDVVLSPEEISAMAIWGQRLGFSPANLAELREWNSAAIQYNRSLKNEKNDLLRRYRDAVHDGDMQKVYSIISEMNQFNAALPRNPSTGGPNPGVIDQGSLEQSLTSVESRRKRTQRGVEMNPVDRATYGRQSPI